MYGSNRIEKVTIRMSPEEKKKLKDYADNRNIKMSEAIRELCEKIFKGEN